jgi:hypothetical protein
MGNTTVERANPAKCRKMSGRAILAANAIFRKDRCSGIIVDFFASYGFGTNSTNSLTECLERMGKAAGQFGIRIVTATIQARAPFQDPEVSQGIAGFG